MRQRAWPLHQSFVFIHISPIQTKLKRRGERSEEGKYQSSLPVPTSAIEPLVAVIGGDGIHGESRCLGKEERCGEQRHNGEAHFDVLVW